MKNNLRHRAALELDPALRFAPGLSMTNRFIAALILISSLLAVLETEPTILSGRELMFSVLETIILLIFIAEYGFRVWSSVENAAFPSRLKYILTPGALLDLAVILIIMLTMYGFEGVILRLLRLGRLLRLAKLGRYSTAMKNISEAVSARRFELTISVAIAMTLLLISASALYVIESEHQPEAFGSIPRAMWWSIATLTTVGYGDVVPITALGRVFAAITALTGIGLIAMPAGILASAFSDAVQKRRNESGKADPQ